MRAKHIASGDVELCSVNHGDNNEFNPRVKMRNRVDQSGATELSPELQHDLADIQLRVSSVITKRQYVFTLSSVSTLLICKL